ncbi:MAG: hypothetical protein ACT4NP_18760 [Pseudonocardiales bacterium]
MFHPRQVREPVRQLLLRPAEFETQLSQPGCSASVVTTEHLPAVVVPVGWSGRV